MKKRTRAVEGDIVVATRNGNRIGIIIASPDRLIEWPKYANLLCVYWVEIGDVGANYPPDAKFLVDGVNNALGI